MPPGKLSLSESTHSQLPAPPPVLPCWPICKYSYSVTPISSRTQSPWSHFAQRDNIYLVLQTSQPGDVFDHLGSQTRMKIFWGAQTLEDIELTALVQKTIPSGNFFQDPQPALIAIGRSPVLAIKYLHQEKMRRFQIKFVLEEDYQSAVASLVKVGCLVKPPPAPQDATEQISKGPSAPVVRPIFAPVFHPAPDHNPSQRSPPRTPSTNLPSSTSSDSTVTGTPFGYPPMPPKDMQQSQSFFGINKSKADPRTPTRDEEFKRPSESSHTSSTNTYSSSPPEPYHIPDKVQDLPPPRPPPGLSNSEQPKISAVPVSSSGRSSLASALPPLPQPTPVGTLRAPSRAQTSAGYISHPIQTHGPNNGVFRQANDEGLSSKKTVPAYINAIFRDMSNSPHDNNPNEEDRLSLQSPIPEDRNTPNHFPRSGNKFNAASTRDDTLVGSKRGKGMDDSEDRNEHKQKKRQLINIDEERAREEEDFAQMEEFIINAIHDDSFVRLVERIGGIWQRMGFEKAVPKLFTEE